MNLKEIAAAVVQYDSTFACRVQHKKNQIVVKCADWPDETVLLLSPYYQQRVFNGTFNKEDLENLFVEVDRIREYGM